MVFIRHSGLVFWGGKMADSWLFGILLCCCLLQVSLGQLRFTRKPVSKIRPVGSRLFIFCRATAGVGEPEVKWSRDGYTTTLPPNVKAESGRLRFDPLTKANAGNYTCTATSDATGSFISETISVRIVEKLHFAPRPVNMKLELGARAKIHCRATAGQVKPEVEWRRDGTSRLPPHIEDQDGTLVFNPVMGPDGGRYTCIAEIDATGELISATITLDVIAKPKFIVKPHNTTASLGGTVMLHCSASGSPQPMISWDKNGQMLRGQNGKRYKILGNGTLQISQIYEADVGIYGCTAGNRGGFTREVISLKLGPWKSEYSPAPSKDCMVLYREHHAMGGTNITRGWSSAQCRDWCASKPDCLAVDYNGEHRDCYEHKTSFRRIVATSQRTGATRPETVSQYAKECPENVSPTEEEEEEDGKFSNIKDQIMKSLLRTTNATVDSQ